MFKRSWIAALALVLTLPALASAGGMPPLPARIGYTIYNQGHKVGHCDITVKQTPDSLILDSTTHIDFDAKNKLDITCRTEANPSTYLVRHLEWKGEKAGVPMSGNMTIEADSIYGATHTGDASKTDYVISPNDVTLFLEDYVMDHEVLLARAHVVDGEHAGNYSLMFPSSFSLTNATVVTASKAEIESEDAAVVCDKILIGIQGSDPFASFYDPARGLPVYLAFPQTNVEVFLDAFFGNHPVSRYREHSPTDQ